MYANGFFSWQGAGSECVFHELTPFRWEGCSFNSPTEKVGKDVWRRGVPLQRKELLYKPAKAGCAGHSLPTVTRSPARADTHRPLLCTKTVRLGVTVGAAHVGAPLLTARSLFHGAGSFKDLGLSQLRKGKCASPPSAKIVMVHCIPGTKDVVDS